MLRSSCRSPPLRRLKAVIAAAVLDLVRMALPGLGGGVTLVRTWNSVWPTAGTGSIIGMFGPGWRSTFEESVYAGSDHYLKYSRGDGSFWSFGWVSQTNNTDSFALAGPTNVNATLVQTTS